MKQVNETYFPRGGPKKEPVHKKSSLFRKDRLKQKKQVLKKKVEEKLVEEHKKSQTNKIQALSFNTLVEGMLVVGCVRGIRPRYVSLSLPGGIFARLLITSISPGYTEALEELQQEEITKKDCPPLNKLFQIGEMLCCCISSIQESGRFCPVIQVSISPEDVNYGRSHSSVKVGDLLIAAIESVEDYGYVMYTGIEGLKAFLNDVEAVKYIESRNHNRPLVRGQVLRCMVTKAVGSDSSTVAQLTANPDTISGLILKSNITIEKLIPTATVNIIVKNVQSDGLEVKVLGCPADILCYVGLQHLQSCWAKPEHSIPGTKLTATVLYVVPHMKMVFLSLKKEFNGIVEQKLKNGTIIDNAQVAAVTPIGIYVIIGKKEDEFKGFISLWHIDGSPGPEELQLKYPVGIQLQTRIINFDPIQQTYMCSLEQTFINEKYVTLSDVHVGEIVDCTVKELKPVGAHLSLGRLSVFTPISHVSDFPVKIITTKLSVGKQVKARVLSVSEIGNSILVTLKPTLLNNEPLMSYEQAHKGDQYYGVIRNISEKGLHVSFYNEVSGFLPFEYIGYDVDITKDFVQGQLAKCYIVDVDCKKRKLILGFTQTINQPDQNMLANNADTVVHTWFKGLNKRKRKADTYKKVDEIIKKGIRKFVSHIAACHENQDYQTGTRLTGNVVYSTGDGIYVEFEDDVKGILSGRQHMKCKLGQDVDVIVLWQNPTTKLLYLEHVDTFLEDQNVLSNAIIGSHVTGRVLFSKPDMVICVLMGKNILAYVPCFDNSVLDLESEHTLIVQNVIDDYIVCLVRESLIKIYNDHNLKVPEHILSSTQLKSKGKCSTEMGQSLVEENKDNEGNYRSKSNKQNKRKCEESFTKGKDEISVTRKKIKKKSVVSDEEVVNARSVENKQKKKQKKKEILKDDNDDDDDDGVNAEIVETLKKKMLMESKKSVGSVNVNSAKESKNNSSVSYNKWTIVEDKGQNRMENKFSAEKTGQTENAKSETRKMQNKKKQEDRNTNINIEEQEDEAVVDSNFLNSNKDGKACVETVKTIKNNRKVNQNIFNVQKQESCETNSKITESTQRKKQLKINSEPLVNGKKIKLKKNQSKSKSLDYVEGKDDDDNGGCDDDNDNGEVEYDAKHIQYSSDTIDEDRVKATQRIRGKILSEHLTLSEVGFSWDAKPEDLMGTIDGEPAAADDSEEDEESSQKLKNKARMTPAEKREAAKEAELILRQKESELLEAEVNPQSADQFDRVLLSNPGNAELWIKYMAYHLQATEIEKARSVARRALQTMSYRSEGERLNVWIALLNLENMYGTQESLKETLDEALKTNNDYLVYSRMLDIYANSNKPHDAEQLVNVMLRKYRESEECWLHCCTDLMKCGLYDKARNILQRALSSLNTKAHVNLISKFALLENKHGFKEKAVTLLENVLITYPGRVDVWSVYVDMLVKSENVKEARQVLERAANQKLTARKMKSIYSKWLSFEEKFGDENSVQHVKTAALCYVNTITSKLE